MEDFSYFDYSNPFCFLVIGFYFTFSTSCKILTNYAYYYILIMIVYSFGTSLFFRACFTSFHTHASLLTSSSVTFSYFIRAVSMRECLGKQSCMSFSFPIAILNGTFFSTAELQVHNVYSERNNRILVH